MPRATEVLPSNSRKLLASGFMPIHALTYAAAVQLQWPCWVFVVHPPAQPAGQNLVGHPVSARTLSRPAGGEIFSPPAGHSTVRSGGLHPWKGKADEPA
jgi:hypothetical protein